MFWTVVTGVVGRTIPTKGNTAELVLTVLHRNFLGVDEFLGQATLPLNQVLYSMVIYFIVVIKPSWRLPPNLAEASSK